jgi:hypothetical protein
MIFYAKENNKYVISIIIIRVLYRLATISYLKVLLVSFGRNRSVHHIDLKWFCLSVITTICYRLTSRSCLCCSSIAVTGELQWMVRLSQRTRSPARQWTSLQRVWPWHIITGNLDVVIRIFCHITQFSETKPWMQNRFTLFFGFWPTWFQPPCWIVALITKNSID